MAFTLPGTTNTIGETIQQNIESLIDVTVNVNLRQRQSIIMRIRNTNIREPLFLD
jgi:hypothetical protein